MKNSMEYAARLKRLCNQLHRQEGKAVTPELGEPIVELVRACLSDHTTESRSRIALNRLYNTFVDFNELRVCRVEEVADSLGKNFPQAKEVGQQIIAMLKEVFNERDSLDLTWLAEGGKREARLFLGKLKNTNPYVVASVMLQSIGAHAFPVNDQMLKMLRAEEVVAPRADARDVQSFLERRISVRDIRSTYFLLRRYADHFHPRRSASQKKTAAKKVRKEKSAKTKNKTSETHN